MISNDRVVTRDSGWMDLVEGKIRFSVHRSYDIVSLVINCEGPPYAAFHVFLSPPGAATLADMLRSASQPHGDGRVDLD